MKNKKYKCTMEIKRLFQELYEILLKMCVERNIPEMAEKSFIEYRVQHKKTWELIYNIYPELINYKVSYDADSNCLEILNEC